MSSLYFIYIMQISFKSLFYFSYQSAFPIQQLTTVINGIRWAYLKICPILLPAISTISTLTRLNLKTMMPIIYPIYLNIRASAWIRVPRTVFVWLPLTHVDGANGERLVLTMSLCKHHRYKCIYIIGLYSIFVFVDLKL